MLEKDLPYNNKQFFEGQSSKLHHVHFYLPFKISHILQFFTSKVEGFLLYRNLYFDKRKTLIVNCKIFEFLFSKVKSYFNMVSFKTIL